MEVKQKAISLETELKMLYKKWPVIRAFLKELGCNTKNGEDIFQEALLIFSRKMNDPKFELNVEPFFYVKNTCKFLWYNQSRKEEKMRFSEINESISEKENDWWEKEEKLRSIELAISKIGAKCQQLLEFFYGLKMGMAEIAKKLDLRNEKVAKAQKYRCIQKVKEIISTNH